MEALVIVAIVIFTAMVLLFVVLTFVSCLKYNTTEISAAPATFDGLVSGGTKPRVGGGRDGESQTPPGEDSREAGTTREHDRETLPVRYLSRRWLRSLSRRNSSEAETSSRKTPFLENDPLNRLPSYRFLFRAPPPQQPPRDSTATTGDAPAEALAPKTSDQGSRRSLASYFSKSSSNTVTGNTTKDRGSRRSLASYFSALSSRSVIGGSAEKTKEASNPIEDEEPRRRRRELPQYASKGSLESWRQAPPPAYVSTKKAVGGESTPPPAYVSMKAFMPNESSEAEDSHEDHSWHLAAARQSPNPTQDRAEDSTPKPAKDAVTDGDVLPIASPREESSSAPAGSCGVKASNEGNRETGSARADDAANARLSTFGHGSAEKTTVSVDGQESQMDSSAASVDLRRKSSVNFVLSAPGKLSGSSAGSVEAAGLEGETTVPSSPTFASVYAEDSKLLGDHQQRSECDPRTGPSSPSWRTLNRKPSSSSAMEIDDSTYEQMERQPSMDSMMGGSTPTDVTMSLFSSSYSTGKNWKGDLHNISFKTGPDKYVPSDASSSGSEDA